MKRKAIYAIPILALLLGFGMHQYLTKSLQPDAYTLRGDKINWGEYKSQWIIVNFFAQWCAPCLREIPELNRLNRALPENTYMFMVSFDPLGKEELQQVATRHGISVPLIVNTAEIKLPVLKPDALPATYIVSPDGKTVKTLYGEVTETQLQTLLAQLKLQGF